MDICDRNGKVIAISSPPESRIFDKMTIPNANLAGMELEGISFEGSVLRASDFTGADLYGANLADADLGSCTLAGADLRSSFLHRVSFRNADLRSARMGLDEMGGGLTFYDVDFTGANLDGADMIGGLYDSLTVFPAGFNPAARGLKPVMGVPQFKR